MLLGYLIKQGFTEYEFQIRHSSFHILHCKARRSARLTEHPVVQLAPWAGAGALDVRADGDRTVRADGDRFDGRVLPLLPFGDAHFGGGVNLAPQDDRAFAAENVADHAAHANRTPGRR